ncbi:hypothetical protein GDO78_016664 [Eleutherodactylus coqui]|uniref:Uncharacterized protein n=1 Tax=Eleutherodactylus coqui TaxID=57060 RepID=A0A8J6EK41_ELECQ|nr:hypothetical protein GDO78_016664 [Eleutherodactylus coqui]
MGGQSSSLHPCYVVGVSSGCHHDTIVWLALLIGVNSLAAYLLHNFSVIMYGLRKNMWLPPKALHSDQWKFIFKGVLRWA